MREKELKKESMRKIKEKKTKRERDKTTERVARNAQQEEDTKRSIGIEGCKRRKRNIIKKEESEEHTLGEQGGVQESRQTEMRNIEEKIHKRARQKKEYSNQTRNETRVKQESEITKAVKERNAKWKGNNDPSTKIAKQEKGDEKSKREEIDAKRVTEKLKETGWEKEE
ncbi:7664_t:CDS:2 [Rhizophagus irregularis]|nr:7664_t:CDS:2 [Rhizophagus irregularis]